ncbi:MAG: hypothetical protein AAB393_06895 [Bacteroidota bacterium]
MSALRAESKAAADDRAGPVNFRLKDADATLRLFLSTFIIVLTIGYSVGLFFVEHTTALSSRGIQEQMLGNGDSDGAQEIRYAKSTHEMYVFIHNHVLSLALAFFVVGAIFYFSSLVSERMKRLLVVEPLVAVVTTFGGIALVRFVSPGFSWLVLVSGISLFLSYFAMVFLILKELWFTKRSST